MILTILLFIFGIVLLVFCSDKVVKSAVHIATQFGITRFFVGLTVVAFGTSLPELVTSVIAVRNGHSVIALGNVIGSNIVNIGLVLAIVGISGGLVLTKSKRHIIQASILIAAASVILLLSIDGVIQGFDTVILLGLFAVYMWFIFTHIGYQIEHHAHDSEEILVTDKHSEKHTHGHADVHASIHLLTVIAGAFGLWLGAEWVVAGVIEFATLLNVGEGIIAVTAVAIATSLPELAVALQATRKQLGDLVLGDILGANIINLLFVLGVSSMVGPLIFSNSLMILLPVVILFSIAVWIFLKMKSEITKYESSMLLFAYILTMILLSLTV